MQCPDPTALARFALRDLPPDGMAELGTHVDSCPACRAASSALVTASRLDDDGDGGDQTWTAPALAAGAAFGRYVILHQLGAGAASVVYAAYDPELDRKVALKLLRRRSGPQVERLLREGRALARLTHPNIVTIYEVGDAQDQLYIALELVDGVTARQWAAIAPRSWREVRDVYVAAGRGLAALHGAELVHRDVKPDNIVVASDGSVRLVDFGLVGAGVGAGTPAYMAPELRAGAQGTYASDQFALCASLAEALGGAGAIESPARVPGARRLRRALARGLAADARDRFPSVSALLDALADRPVWHVVLPAAVAATALVTAGIVVVTRDDAPSANTCASAGAELWTADDHAAIDRAFSTSGRPHARETQARAVPRLTAVAAAWRGEKVAACVAYHRRGELSAERFDRRTDCLDRQRRAFEATHARLAQGDVSAIDHAIELVSSLPKASDCRDDTTLARMAPLPADPAVRSAIATAEDELAAAEAAYHAGDPQAALAKARSAHDAAKATRHDPVIARTAFRTAALLDLAGDDKAARPLLDEAVAAAARARLDAVEARAWLLLLYLRGAVDNVPEPELATTRNAAEAAAARAADPATQARLANILGLVAKSRGDFAAARDQFDRALEQWKKAGQDGPEVAQVQSNRSLALAMLGDLADAVAAAREAANRDVEMYGPNHPSYADSLLSLSSRELLVGETVTGIEHANRALEIITATHGADSGPAMVAHQNVASALGQAGKLVEAEPHARRAMALAEKLRGPEHPETAKAIFTVANLAGERRDYKTAEIEAARALKIVQATLGRGHPFEGAILANRGNWALAAGDPVAAERHLREALQGMAKMPDGPYAATIRALLGDALAVQGKHAAALVELEAALATRQRIGADPLDIADSQFILARALWATGKRPRALELARAAAVAFAAPGDTAARFRKDFRAWVARNKVPLPEPSGE